MIDATTLMTYTLIVLGFVFIPGPATLLKVARSASSGTKVGIATGAGIAAGDVLHTSMAIIGISAIIAASATLFSVIKFVGAGYLVYLGLRAILEKAPADFVRRRLPISAGKAFRQAILAEVLNPKTALFFLAFLPQFVHEGRGRLPRNWRSWARSMSSSVWSAPSSMRSAPPASAISSAATRPF